MNLEFYTCISEKIQHHVIGWTRRYLRARQFALGTGRGVKQGRYLFARLHISYLPLFLSSLSFLSLFAFLFVDPSQDLLMVIVFCKTHLAAGNNPLFPVVELNSTQHNTHLHLQYLTSSLHTWLVGAEFFICAQKPSSVSHRFKCKYSRTLSHVINY